jgi:hypothetical protein
MTKRPSTSLASVILHSKDGMQLQHRRTKLDEFQARGDDAYRLVAQAALIELLEEAGLPPICAALAVQEDADKQLGKVLAEAVQVLLKIPALWRYVQTELVITVGVKRDPSDVICVLVQAQRTRKNPHKNIWDELDRGVKELPDIEGVLKERMKVSLAQ